MADAKEEGEERQEEDEVGKGRGSDVQAATGLRVPGGSGAARSGGSMPTPAPWFVDVQSCLGDLVLAVTRLEGNIHFSDTTEAGPAYSVFYSPGGGGRPRRRRRPPIHR